MNNAVVIPLYSITFLPWSSAFGVGCEDSSLSIYCLFALNIVIKDLSFVTCNIFEEWMIFLLPWKKICQYDMIYLIFLIKNMRSPNTHFAHFSYFFKWIRISWLQVLILEYFCTDCIPSIFLKHLDQGLMNVLVWVHLSMTYCQNET